MIKLHYKMLLVFIMHAGLQAMGRGCADQFSSAAKRLQPLSLAAATAQSYAAQVGTSAVAAADNRIGQTEAFLRCLPNYEVRLSAAGLSVDTKLLNDIIVDISDTEKENSECYSVVHGFSLEIYVLLLFIRELMSYHGMSFNEGWAIPIRRPSDWSSLDVEEYIRIHGLDINDQSGIHRPNLLSVNFSFPGNLSTGESTLYYFFKNRSCAFPGDLLRGYLSEIDEKLAADTILLRYINLVLMTLASKVGSQEGCILQILIPREEVDRYLRLAEGGGKMLCKKIRLTDGSFLEDGWDDELGCYTKISPFLALYTDENKVHLLRDFLPAAQGRLILHRDLFSGRCHVETEVHDNISDEKYDDLIASLKSLVHRIRNYNILEMFDHAKYSFYSADSRVRNAAIDFFKELLDKNVHTAEILEILLTLKHVKNYQIKSSGIDLLRAFFEKEYNIPELFKVLIELSNDENPFVCECVYQLCTDLISCGFPLEKSINKKIHEAIFQILKNLSFNHDLSGRLYRYFELFVTSTKHNLQNAIKLVEALSEHEEVNIKLLVPRMLCIMVENGYGVQVMPILVKLQRDCDERVQKCLTQYGDNFLSIMKSAVSQSDAKRSTTWDSFQKKARYRADCRSLIVKNLKIPFKKDTVLRIATYNVHYWKNPYGARHNIIDVMTAIKEMNADVLILQEMSIRPDVKQALEDLGYRFGYDSFCEKWIGEGGEPFGEIILSRRPLIVESVHQGYQNRWHGFSRVELMHGEKKIAVYGTHATVDNVEKRASEIKQLVEYAKKDTADYIVLGADWNAIRRQDYSHEIWEKLKNMYKEELKLDPPPVHELQPVMEAGFKDSFTCAGVKCPKWTVWNGTMVDFLFCRIPDGAVCGSYVYYTDASDHLPIITDIAIN